MDLRREIEATFGPKLFELPLFYRYPDGLRFELAEGGTAIEQFLSAHRKALSVARTVFRGSDRFVVCLRLRTPQRGRARCRQLLHELRAAQIPLPRSRALWADLPRPHHELHAEEPQDDLTLAFPASTDRLSNVLWCALAGELGISPRLQCAVFLINLHARIAMLPYDDRGMDVVGPNQSMLRQLFTRHHALLLPHDLPRMQRSFGAP